MSENTIPAAAPISPVAETIEMPQTMVALVIDHNHGTDVTIHRTHEGALAQVDQFVSDWWADEMGDEPMPEDPAAARTYYFENVGDESYTIADAALMD